MLALKALVIGMGVLIVAGVALIGATLFSRMSSQPGAIASLMLDEPAGTRIVSASLAPDRLAIALQGGGPDPDRAGRHQDRASARPCRSGALMAHNKPHLPEKVCLACQRPFTWRKKWAAVWDDVRYCSDACRTGRRNAAKTKTAQKRGLSSTP